MNGAQYRIPCVGYIFPMSHKRIGTLKMINSSDIFNSDIIAIKDCILSNLKTTVLREATVLFHNNFSS